jgi:tRNA pseudouridine38-40 synthase
MGIPLWRPGARIRIDVAYVGAGFHGWQEQPGLRTVQGELSQMLARLLGRLAKPIAAGRTDAGVHARGQVCHLTVQNADEAERLQRRLSQLAPEDMQIVSVRPVSGDFNARFSALARRYSYCILLRRDIFREPFAHYLDCPLNREAMSEAATCFLGENDFASFCKKASWRDTGHGNQCVVDLCHFDWKDDLTIFQVRANRFLHNMVRNMVGTLLEVGRGRLRPDEIPGILAARDRSLAGRKMPAKGLCLEEVLYPHELLDPGYRRPDGSPQGISRYNHEGDAS